MGGVSVLVGLVNQLQEESVKSAADSTRLAMFFNSTVLYLMR